MFRNLQPGSYVVAVSGGVDSMVLLNILAGQVEQQNQPVETVRYGAATEPSRTRNKNVRLLVAHFDHGIREDSREDRRLVQQAAEFYQLPFVYAEGKLGAGASEATARNARYKFLRKVQRSADARAIITAHHQDDALETAILNIVRGTGTRGLSSLGESHNLLRPLMITGKDGILQYATTHDLVWREDSTNQDLAYARNYVRQQVLPRLDDGAHQSLWQIIQKVRGLNADIDQSVATSLHQQSRAGQLDRNWFNHLPHQVAREIMAGWLRAHQIRDFDRKALERLVVAAKVSQAGKQLDVLKGVKMIVTTNHLALTGQER